MSQEVWKSIARYEDLYEVSSLGRVRAIFAYQKLPTPRLLKPRKYSTNRGPTAIRFRVSLSRNGEKKDYPVHLLVCEAFHGPRPSQWHQAAHGNGDGLDNREQNLRWATPAENYEDMKRHGIHRTAMRIVRGSLPEEAIFEIRRRRAAGELLDSIAADYRQTRTQICAITKGRRGGPL